MTDPTHERVRDLFGRALELDRAARASFLQSECGNDAALQARVEVLLSAADDDRFLTAPTTPGHALASKSEEGPGTLIGPYRLVRQIGEGGFGVVFLAEQLHPVTRRVALKIIKLGMDTKQVVARFEVERQALAMMDHPHIARVIDAGATETGRPYFVMEYVPGRAITQYCDEENLAIQPRLELFEQVCQAVQHAHSKGIIHRDLKPSNILVATVDGNPQVKIIDFGIAKATSQKLTEMTLATEHLQVIGTLQYMSPEQASGSLDIDTRTDVYALGVILYELLTGSTPFDLHTMQDAFFSEIQRMIREVDPPKPSTRLNESSETIASVAARRRIEPKRLGLLVRGELDWIVMKALEKDRLRRYESAHGLGEDLRRYLGGDAVVAAPPSALYRLRKFSRRNRGTVLAASAVAAALLIGLVAFAWQANVARHERDAAVLARTAEAEQRRIADEQRAEAKRQQGLAEANAAAESLARKRAEATSEFVTDALHSADPNYGGEQGITVATAMEQAAKLLDEGAFRDEPDIEASMRRVIADVLSRNGRMADALPLAEKSLAILKGLPGDHEQEIATATNLVATIQQDLGRANLAEPMFERALEMQQRLHPGDHDDVAKSLNNLAMARVHLLRHAEAEPLLVRSLEMRERMNPSGDDADLAMSLNNLATITDQLGRRSESIPIYERSLAMYDRLYDAHPQLAMSLYNLGQVYISTGRLADSEKNLERALEMYVQLFESDHPDVARALSGVANIRRVMGRLAESESMGVASLDMRKRLFPGDHREVALAIEDLTRTQKEAGKSAEALVNAEELLAMRRRLAPSGNPDTAKALDLVASIHESRDELAAAAPLLAEAVEIYVGFYGPDHVDVGRAKNRLAYVLVGLGEVDEAIATSNEAVAILRRAVQGDSPLLAAGMATLGLIYDTAKRPAESEAQLAEALAMVQRYWKGDHWDIAQAFANHGRALRKLGRKDEARQAYDAAVAMHRRRTPGGSTDLASALNNSGSALLAMDEPAAALPLLEEALTMAERLYGAASPRLARYQKSVEECRTKLGR